MAIKDDWHLDKRVNVSIIVALLIQATVIGVGWGVLNEKVDQIERRLQGFATRGEIMDDRVDKQGEEIATLAAEIKSLTRQLERLYAQGEATNTLLRQLIANNAANR